MDQKSLKEMLSYNPKTGLFTWIKINVRAHRVKVGDIAGWNNRFGYIGIAINGKTFLAHRLAWLYVYGEFPVGVIDHINRVKFDNRIVNLRDTTQSENLKNCVKSKKNTSGCTGVYWIKRRNMWRAMIMSNRTNDYLGDFKDKFEAICVRKSAENKYGFSGGHGSLRKDN